MLNFVAKLARWLYRVRVLLWCVAGAAAIALAVGIIGDAASEGMALVALIALLWGVFLVALAYAFVAEVPSVRASDPWLTRLGARLRRAMLWCLAVVTVGLSVGLGLLTLRSISVALG